MYNQADPSAVQWYGTPDMYQQMLMRLGQYGLQGQDQNQSGGWPPQSASGSGFQKWVSMGSKMGSEISGDEDKNDDGMQNILNQLLASYGGGK